MTALPHEALRHYADSNEANRLSSGVGELERVRTEDILARYLPAPPGAILDVGGAAGVYALKLARQGYRVRLIDPVPLHVAQALAGSRAQPDHSLDQCIEGDARKLPFDGETADAALLLGPLYHLVERADRVRALKEVRRVLRPGGRVFAAIISRFASLLDGLSRDLVADPEFVAILRRDLRDGQHRNPAGHPEYFTTTFFHHPEDLKSEIRDSGLTLERMIGVEGPAWIVERLPEHWNHPEKRSLLLELLREVEEDPFILGASAHIVAVLHK